MTLLFFFSYYNAIKKNGSYYPETPTKLAYSVYKYNNFSYYKDSVVYSNGIQVNKVTDKKKIPVFEHPGYGWLMGLVWKVTGSLKYYDMQVLQILLFAFSCLLLYWGLLLVLPKGSALLSACFVSFFLPLLFLNVNPIRDVYCFYGAVVLFYLFMKVFYENVSVKKTVIGGLFVALCQWMRPTIFGPLVLGILFTWVYAFCDKRKQLQSVLMVAFILIGTNIGGFWIPWTLFNKKVHGRYFAAPSGQQLLDSMGWRGPNKINPQCPDTNNGLYCDSCVTSYTRERFNLDESFIGTQKMDDKMKEAFWEWFWQDPVFWFKGFFWRIKKVLFLDLTWSITPGWNWEYYNSFSHYGDRLKVAYSFGFLSLLEFLFRRWYVRLFMLMGYFGAVCLLYNRNYFLLGLLISLTAGGIAPAIISHPEHRYVTPFYFIYPVCAGYAGYCIVLYLVRFLKRKKLKGVVPA